MLRVPPNDFARYTRSETRRVAIDHRLAPGGGPIAVDRRPASARVVRASLFHLIFRLPFPGLALTMVMAAWRMVAMSAGPWWYDIPAGGCDRERGIG
jgi:hypothetical protein